MTFRSVALIALWTLLIGPVLDYPGVSRPSASTYKRAAEPVVEVDADSGCK